MKGLTPAALVAGLSGDMKNFIAATTPGGIEAQEKQGQIAQCFSETLPIDGTIGGKVGGSRGCSGKNNRATWEALGFVFGEPEDDLFVNVKFPEGWRKQVTEHSMWTHLLDANGRKRGSIFYKAAFYDRSAHVHLEGRFHATWEPVGGWEAKERRYVGVVKDCNVVVFTTVPTEVEPDARQNREAWLKWCDTKDAKVREAENWLRTKYPDHQNVCAYWD